jgi:hypothetical protein
MSGTVHGMHRLFHFPREVNETAARLVAGGVVAIAALYLLSGSTVLLAALTYGFLARVLTGPLLSPLALVVTRLIVPRLTGPHRFSPGAPKRFAQGIGLAVSGAALVAALSGTTGLAEVLIVMLIGAAGLEAAFGFCLGCAIFKRLMRWGVIPEQVCAECQDLTRGRGRAAGVSARRD